MPLPDIIAVILPWLDGEVERKQVALISADQRVAHLQQRLAATEEELATALSWQAEVQRDVDWWVTHRETLQSDQRAREVW